MGNRTPRRSIGKVDRLPPEQKAAVEQMLLSNQMTYREIVEYLKEQGHEMSQMAICNYARKYLRNVQMMSIAQDNFKMMMAELDKYPNLDTTEAIVRLASQNVFNTLAELPEEKWQKMEPEDLLRQANGLVRAAAYKSRIDIQNQDTYTAALDEAKSVIFATLAKDEPELYQRVAAYLNKQKQDANGGSDP